MKYTVSIATWYNGKWHLDPATETALMDELTAIIAGHKLAALGAMALYKNEEGQIFVEGAYKRLEPAFADMIA